VLKSAPLTTPLGIVLFGHGSRDPLWHLPMQAVAQRIRARDSSVLVQCAYLELTQPDLAEATRSLVAAGAQRITVVPVFLGLGKHAREDLPALVSALRLEYPGLAFTLQCAVGEDPRMIDQLAHIALS
jgi:sirohydrochlorin cobaltochelatase